VRQGSRLPIPRHKPGGRFLQGPIPWDWLCLAAVQPGRALQVAIALWFLVGVKKSPRVQLSGSVLRALGVGHDSARRGLQRLEASKLVRVERKIGRSPIVTVLEAPDFDEHAES
jgi:hypothetical protein